MLHKPSKKRVWFFEIYVFVDRDSCSPAEKSGEEGGRKKKEMVEKPTFSPSPPFYGNCPFHPTTYVCEERGKEGRHNRD